MKIDILTNNKKTILIDSKQKIACFVTKKVNYINVLLNKVIATEMIRNKKIAIFNNQYRLIVLDRPILTELSFLDDRWIPAIGQYFL